MPVPSRRPSHVLAHLSDTHIRPADDPLVAGLVDTRATLARALGVLGSWNLEPEAWVFSGDLADAGHPEAYEHLDAVVTPAAEAAGARVLWCNGNHDDRLAFRETLLGEDPSDAPLNREWWLGDLRVLALDTNVTGASWGRVAPESLAWLADRLADPAPDGTVLVMHHAPLPQVQDATVLWSLEEQDALADIVRGSDVRLILSGHFHQTASGSFAGVPVWVGTSMAYTQDVTAGRTLRGQAGGQGFSLVSVYADQVVVTAVPLTQFEAVHPPVTPHDTAERVAARAAAAR